MPELFGAAEVSEPEIDALLSVVVGNGGAKAAAAENQAASFGEVAHGRFADGGKLFVVGSEEADDLIDGVSVAADVVDDRLSAPEQQDDALALCGGDSVVAAV